MADPPARKPPSRIFSPRLAFIEWLVAGPIAVHGASRHREALLNNIRFALLCMHRINSHSPQTSVGRHWQKTLFSSAQQSCSPLLLKFQKFSHWMSRVRFQIPLHLFPELYCAQTSNLKLNPLRYLQP
ncbi:uncharacterized protein J3R85_002399 [Psidium guajava]|nr:uncharacterized protein J3R85_002399 [Psidium guajava]